MTTSGDTAPRPTLETVAAAAGVSRSTVSRVINDSPRVSPDVRTSVEEVIARLGYVPNRAARTLVTRRTDTVALFLSESEERVFGEPYFAGIIRGISAGLAETGLRLLLVIAQSAAEHERFENYLTGQHVDGVLLVSLHGNDQLPAHLEKHGVPTVLGGVPIGYRPFSYVDADNRGGARQAVEHLLARGRSRLATIMGPQDMRVGVDRFEGFTAALEQAGLPWRQARGDFSEGSGERAMERLLAEDPAIDAVFAASDPMAVGAMRVLAERGRSVPGDVAVVGFDDSSTARYARPSLTSVHQPLGDMGREMVRLLVARIKGEILDPPVVILDTHLVVRESS
jgi:DNA-binding LacI/PurR family transcriptional regulator